ncbi:MAG: hypothetical protein ACE5FU_12160, partial [Nitrospinota bacterium]
YDYMLRSKGPDKRKNTEDDIRVINSVTDNPKKKKTVRKNSSTENLLENLGSEKSPKAISIDDLPSSGLEEGGVELSIEDFEKLVDQKRNE